MFQQIVQLDTGETLRMNWQRNYTFFTIYLNGEIFGSFPNKAALKLGANFNLPDRRRVFIILSNGRLSVWYKGKDLINDTLSG